MEKLKNTYTFVTTRKWVRYVALFVLALLLAGWIWLKKRSKKVVITNSLDTSEKARITVNILGDSLTQNHDFKFTQRVLKINELRNYGIFKNTAADLYDRYKEMNKTADVVIVWIGTNDHYQNIQIAAFKLKLNGLLIDLCKTYPTARIVFMTPPQSSSSHLPNTNGFVLRDYANAMIEICRRQSVQVIDLYHEAGINQYNINNYSDDGMHFTPKGYEVIEKAMIKHLVTN